MSRRQPGRPTPASNGTAMTLVTDIRQDRTVLAAFTYNEVALSDRLTATLGARITQENIEGRGAGRHIFDDGTIGYNNVGGLGLAAGSNEIDDTRLTGNLALAYDTGAGTAYARLPTATNPAASMARYRTMPRTSPIRACSMRKPSRPMR